MNKKYSATGREYLGTPRPITYNNDKEEAADRAKRYKPTTNWNDVTLGAVAFLVVVYVVVSVVKAVL